MIPTSALTLTRRTLGIDAASVAAFALGHRTEDLLNGRTGVALRATANLSPKCGRRDGHSERRLASLARADEPVVLGPAVTGLRGGGCAHGPSVLPSVRIARSILRQVVR